jgi:hypothetical protein
MRPARCEQKPPTPFVLFLEEGKMEQAIVLTLTRSDAQALVGSLRRRAERLCDIRRELCEPEEGDELERQERAYFEEETAVIERILAALDAVLAAPAGV